MAFDQVNRGPNIVLLIVYLLFAVYFINYPLGFFSIPESWATAEPWIIFIGGVLILLGAINYFRVKRRAF